TCQLFPQASGFVGGWPAIRAAPVRAGALTPSILLVAHRCRVGRQHRGLARRRTRAPRHVQRRHYASYTQTNAISSTHAAVRRTMAVRPQSLHLVSRWMLTSVAILTALLFVP